MKKSFGFFVGIFLCFALTCCSFKTNNTEEPYKAPKATHPNTFYDPRLFKTISPEDIKPFEGRVYGAVVPTTCWPMNL